MTHAGPVGFELAALRIKDASHIGDRGPIGQRHETFPTAKLSVHFRHAIA